MKLSVLIPLDFLAEAVDPNEVRYHKDIGFPDDLVLPRGFDPVVRLQYGSHAREESIKEKYGVLNLPKAVDLRKVEMFEVATDRGSNVVKKVCIRMSHDAKKDIVIVIMVPSGFVKTVWANLKTDRHKTLNHSNYHGPDGKPAGEPQQRPGLFHQPIQRNVA